MLEIQQRRGDSAAVLGNHHQALEIWKSLVPRCPGSRSILKRVVQLGITCRDSEVVRGSRLALDRFGEHPDFLSSLTATKLHQRQPGLPALIFVGHGVALYWYRRSRYIKSVFLLRDEWFG